MPFDDNKKIPPFYTHNTPGNDATSQHSIDPIVSFIGMEDRKDCSMSEGAENLVL